MNTDPETWTVFRRDKGYCRYCEMDLLQNYSAFSSATMDHLLPRDDATRDEAGNLVLSCAGCNQLLSRAHATREFEERKKLIVQRAEERDHWYRPVVNYLRGKS